MGPRYAFHRAELQIGATPPGIDNRHLSSHAPNAMVGSRTEHITITIP